MKIRPCVKLLMFSLSDSNLMCRASGRGLAGSRVRLLIRGTRVRIPARAMLPFPPTSFTLKCWSLRFSWYIVPTYILFTFTSLNGNTTNLQLNFVDFVQNCLWGLWDRTQPWHNEVVNVEFVDVFVLDVCFNAWGQTTSEVRYRLAVMFGCLHRLVLSDLWFLEFLEYLSC